MSDPVMKPVSSSTVNLVGYDPENQKLHVIFKSGPDKYVYSNVDAETFGQFMNAEHKGSFHAKVFKGNKKYPYEKLRPIPPKLG